MKDITVEIKAEDILKNNYTDSSECAMTKALQRSGYPDFEDCLGLYNNYVGIETDIRYDDIMRKVKGMYKYVSPKGWGIDVKPIEPKDFQATFSADI